MFRQNKRAQVTIFIIIAIVIVVGIISFFIFKNSASTDQQVPSAISPVYDYVQGCLEDSFEEAIFIIGFQGLRINISTDSIQTNITNVTFVLRNNKSELPSLKQIEKEIEGYVYFRIEECLNQSILGGTYEVSYSNMSVSSQIIEDKSTVILSVPMIIKKGESSYELNKNYNVEKKIRLGELYIITSEIVDQLIKNSAYIDIGYLTNKDYDIGVIDYGKGEYIYSFEDNRSKIGGENFNYMFAVKI